MNNAEYKDFKHMSEEIDRQGNTISSQNLLIKELEKKISKLEDGKKLMKLIDDLGWEFDRMSTSGKETLNEIFKMVGIKQLPLDY